MLTYSNYDVAVCGGGFGGISAALAAARHGKRVVLLEKEYLLGGLGTAGLIAIYLPLCDGLGHQVSFGIAEELFRLSIRYGADGMYPENWLDGIGTRTENDKRFRVQYNPHLFAILAEKLLLENGVDILYGTYAVDVETENDRIVSVITENKSGRQAYAVKSVIDATGDCDIAHFAGAPTESFKQGNVLAAWYYFTDSEGYKLKQLGASDIPEDEKAGREVKKLLSERRFTGLDGKEISDFVCMSHDEILKNWLKKREKDQSVCISTLPTVPQLRMTRKICGEYTLSKEDAHEYFESSVGMVSNWRKRGPVYEVPFEILYSRKIKNLITCGRSVSVTEGMWDVMRVIPCCAVTGQAAGCAAALTDDFSSTDIKELQSLLVSDGVKLHENDIT